MKPTLLLALVLATPLPASALDCIGQSGTTVAVLVDQQLVVLDGTTHRVLDRHAPTGIDAMSVDPRGRAWVTAGQYRFSRGHGFEAIDAFL